MVLRNANGFHPVMAWKGEEWFWIAGIVRGDAFTMLTTQPGIEVKPYHNQQIVTLGPLERLSWLTLVVPSKELCSRRRQECWK